MPITDVVNTAGSLHFEYPRWETRLSTDSNPSTTSGDVRTDLSAISVVQSAAGLQLDYASLEWWVLSPLINRSQPADFTRMLDVLLPDDGRTRVHLGDYVAEVEKVDAQETLTAQSQLRGYHFGRAWSGQLWWDEANTTDYETANPVVFNPQVDGRILPNRSSKKTEIIGRDFYHWVHPEALLTSNAETLHNQTAVKWDLKEAVLAMCWTANSAETHISNPVRADLSILDDAPSLDDVRLPIGMHLPFYLDRLLQPLGYNWCVDYDTGTVVDPPTTEAEKYDKNKPTIRVFQKGVGTEKELYFQAPGAVLDLAQSNLNSYQISRRIGDSVNAVRVIGDYERAEVTIRLVRGWPEADDSLDGQDLKISDPASEYESKPGVHRLWVGNEAGDYIGDRSEITEAIDLSGVFTQWLPHRRELEDPFTYTGEADKKTRRRIHVEYTIDGGYSWQIVKPSFGNIEVLPDQIAIRFTGDEPPAELIEAGAAAGVRVTAVVRGDARLESTAARQPHAVNGREVPLVIDAPQKFRKNWVQTDGDFKSVLAGDPAGEETVDDTSAISTYAESMRDHHEVAEVDCEFTLPGLHLEYEIGDLITKINGREISLNQASASSPSPRYVQVVKREFRYGSDGPQTVLTVDRGERPGPERNA